MNKKEKIECLKNKSVFLAPILMLSIIALALPVLIIIDTINSFLWEGVIMLGWICALILYTFMILITRRNVEELDKFKNKK